MQNTGSALFNNAVAKLGSTQWGDFRSKWLALGAATNQGCAAIVAMVETEHQLSANPKGADATILAELLGELCSATWTPAAQEVQNSNNAVLSKYILRAKRLRARPTTLFRYLNGPGLFESIANALAASGRTTVSRLVRERIDQAQRRQPGTTWKDVLAFVTDDAVWRLIPKDKVPLSLAPAMFVTFDGDANVNRTSAGHMREALGLSGAAHDCFIEARFSSRNGGDLHFPTLAEAGWCSYFRSVPHGASHGLTVPHSRTYAPQPEAVQKTKSLDLGTLKLFILGK